MLRQLSITIRNVNIPPPSLTLTLVYFDKYLVDSVLVSLISFLLSLAKLSRLDSFHEYFIKTQLSDKSKGDIYLLSSIGIISQYSPEIIRKSTHHTNQRQVGFSGD